MTQFCTDDLTSPEIKDSIAKMHAGELQESLRYYEGFFNEGFATPQRKYEVYMSGIRDSLTEALLAEKPDAELPTVKEGDLIQKQIVNLIAANPKMDKDEIDKLDYLMQLQNSSNPHLSPEKSSETPTLSPQEIRYFVEQAVQNLYHSIATYEAHIPSNEVDKLFTKNREAVTRYRATMVTQELKKFFMNYPFDTILAVRTEFSAPLKRTRFEYVESNKTCSKKTMIRKLSDLEYMLRYGDMNGEKKQPLSSYKLLVTFFRSIQADLVNTLERDNRRRSIR